MKSHLIFTWQTCSRIHFIDEGMNCSGRLGYLQGQTGIHLGLPGCGLTLALSLLVFVYPEHSELEDSSLSSLFFFFNCGILFLFVVAQQQTSRQHDLVGRPCGWGVCGTDF